METDVSETVRVKQLGKLLRDIVRLNQTAHLIDADIAVAFPVVSLSAKPPVVFPFAYGSQQTFFHKRHERQGWIPSARCSQAPISGRLRTRRGI